MIESPQSLSGAYRRITKLDHRLKAIEKRFERYDKFIEENKEELERMRNEAQR
jgi:hypothetical protein